MKKKTKYEKVQSKFFAIEEARRKAKKITMEDLSEKIGITRHNFAELRDNKSSIRLRQIVEICDILQFSDEDIRYIFNDLIFRPMKGIPRI